MGWCWWTSKVTDYSCHESTGDSAAKLCRVRQLTSSAAPPSLSSCSCNVRAGSSLMFCSGASGLTVNPRFSQGFQVVITPPPIRQRSIVMSVSVCLCVFVCLFAIISPERHVRSSPNLLRMLPMAVARSSSGGVVICYVLPVLWMTSYLLVSQGCLTSPPS